jgi:DNA replication protein DnaC
MLDQLKQLTGELRLHGMRESLDQVIAQAQKSPMAVQEVLLCLLEAESLDRQTRALASRVKKAKMPWTWTLDTFPFQQQPGVSKTQVLSLAKLDFIQANENIVFIGKPGTGKTGLALSLLRAALMQGYRCRFYNAQDLLNDLYTSLADRTTSSLMKSMASYDLVAIDELGYLTLTPEQINMFFKLIDMRYQKKSTIITTNLDYPKWYDVFKNKELVDAMLDRFQHFCVTIHIDGPSLRRAD